MSPNDDKKQWQHYLRPLRKRIWQKDMAKKYLKFILSGAWKARICMNEEISASKLQQEIIKQSLPFHKQCRKLNRFHRATVVSPFNLLFFSFIVIRSLPLESYIIIKILLPFRKMCPSLGKPGPPPILPLIYWIWNGLWFVGALF